MHHIVQDEEAHTLSHESRALLSSLPLVEESLIIYITFHFFQLPASLDTSTSDPHRKSQALSANEVDLSLRSANIVLASRQLDTILWTRLDSAVWGILLFHLALCQLFSAAVMMTRRFCVVWGNGLDCSLFLPP